MEEDLNTLKYFHVEPSEKQNREYLKTFSNSDEEKGKHFITTEVQNCKNPAIIKIIFYCDESTRFKFSKKFVKNKYLKNHKELRRITYLNQMCHLITQIMVDLELSEYSRNLLRNLKGDYGKIIITSTFRSPEQQAKAMLNNIKKTGIDAQLNLYANPGDAVIRAYNPNYSDADNLSAMIAEIYNQGPRNVSKHCMTAEEYKTLNIMDISRNQIKNPSGFVAELKNTFPNITYFDESYNGCIHIEIQQP